jgi:hypothetical protein
MNNLMNNIKCLKHPHYDGHKSPDLACKVCCSKFVARIRAEQHGQIDDFQKAASNAGIQVKTRKLPMIETSLI